jgi:hypothetical protein
MKRIVLAAAMVLAATSALVGTGGAANAAKAPATTVYDSTETPLPANVVSEGLEAYQGLEYGDEVLLAGSARKLQTVTVTLSSWACQSGTWNGDNCLSAGSARYNMPLTLNIYRASTQQSDNTVRPGTRIASIPTTFALPYRPSANDKKCKGSDAGKWYDSKSKACYNGKAVNATWKLSSLKQTLPDDVVIGVTYNTTHQGYNPVGESASCYSSSAGCFYDSLNVGLNDVDAHPAVGQQRYPGTIFQGSTNPNQYCDGTPAVGVFNQDSPDDSCWTGYIPEFKVTAS